MLNVVSVKNLISRHIPLSLSEDKWILRSTHFKRDQSDVTFRPNRVERPSQEFPCKFTQKLLCPGLFDHFWRLARLLRTLPGTHGVPGTVRETDATDTLLSHIVSTSHHDCSRTLKHLLLDTAAISLAFSFYRPSQRHWWRADGYGDYIIRYVH